MKILSIDPGYGRIGIAVLEKNPSSKEELLYSNCFKTDSSLSLNDRVLSIGQEIESITKKHKPDILAIEKLYFTKNQKTAMGVAEARGVIIYECSRKNMGVCEYTPLQIKIAVTGYGKATKKQVMDMTKRLMGGVENINQDDEIDAIAVGLTCIAHERL